MQVIKARNVHEALPEALRYLLLYGVEEDSRNGKVLRAPQPVTTLYERPRERVIFWPQRDANPFFHFYESLWMLAGRRDVASLTRFVKRMQTFSDDGETFYGAYGNRWRKAFGNDQLMWIIKHLRDDPTCRRQVLQMWHSSLDLVDQVGLKDIPCNLVAHFQINMGALDMTVFNRSNDIVWGCYGANAVHFSILQEFIAAFVGVEVGMYWQVSDNWHAYLPTLETVKDIANAAPDPPYSSPFSPYRDNLPIFPLVQRTSLEIWLEDLEMFMEVEDAALGYRDSFFRKVAVPMVRTHNAFKQNEREQKYEAALREAKLIQAPDWRLAAEQWIERRKARWLKAQDDGVSYDD
ncbi:MAG: hypothetical protein AMS18_09385 [Gemmatimonas sp. SG8_17]|nr:MAG: hypothetical protein AMS18_09385 [Gemmatimonas sp. SG8_17]